MHSENAWFIVAAHRAILIKDLPAGVSHLNKLLLKRLFFNTDEGRDFSKGVPLEVLGEATPVMFFARLGVIVADGDALKNIIHCKGQAGFHPCHCCDVVDFKSDATVGYPLSTCLDERAITFATNDSVFAMLDEVAALWYDVQTGVRGARKKYDDVAKQYGFNHADHNLFNDAQMRAMGVGPISHIMQDWFHIYVVSGCFNFELFFLLMFLSKVNKSIVTDMSAFLKRWKFPKSQGTPRDIIADVNFTDDDHIKCDGHEALQCYGIIAIFLISMLPAGICGEQVSSFLRLCDVIDLLQNLKRYKHGHIAPATLHAAVTAHLRQFLKAYDGLGWKPKHHWALHLHRTLDKFGFLLGLLVCERRHKLVKRWLRDLHSQLNFERCLIKELVVQHLEDLNEPWLDAGLVSPKCPPAGLLQELRRRYPIARYIASSREARVGDVRFTVGDLALFQQDGVLAVGEIYFMAQADAVEIVCVSVYARIPTPSDTTWCRTYRRCDEPQVFSLSALLAPLTYMPDDAYVVVSMPCHFR
jgi:hypothetical protein